MPKQNDQPIEKYDSVFSLFVRLFWAIIGNVALLFTAVCILQHKGGAFHTADIVFWGTVAALVLTRYIDIKFWGDSAAVNQPVSMAPWRKYAIVLLICSTVIWTLLHIINHLFVNK
jgi:hypothetical protein